MEKRILDHQSVCVSRKKLLNRVVDYDEILYGSNAIEGDRDVVIISPITSTLLNG
jgi:hypothetical protein